MGLKWVSDNKKKSKKIRKDKKKRGLSDKLFVSIAFCTLLFVIFVCVVVWKTGDTSPLAYLIPSVFVEATAATGFQWRKAERENIEGKKIENYIRIEQNESPSTYVKSKNEDIGV